jgi:hypothetical protein
MGKRKIHDLAFYMCDWTGIPMHASNCYMPSWDSKNKLVKKGSYYSWECVWAHANHMHCQDHESLDLDRIEKFILAQTGMRTLEPAPSYKAFSHCGGTITENDFTTWLHTARLPQTVVILKADGTVVEREVSPSMLDFQHRVELAELLGDQWSPDLIQKFDVVRKKVNSNQSLVAYYINSTSGSPNQLATNTLKVHLRGDVLLCQVNREAYGHGQRQRYISYTQADFVSQLTRKKRKASDESILTKDEYSQVKRSMESELQHIESVHIGKVSKPNVSRVSKVEHSRGCGKQLGVLVLPQFVPVV